MVDKTAVGRKIFELRKKKGITQDYLAKLVNITPQAISKWENGVTLPDTGLLPTLAELFRVSVDEVLCLHTNKHIDKQKGKEAVMLPGIKYFPCTPPLVGCIKSSLDYIGIHVSTSWISAPYAFMLNINEEVSFKGPEYWGDNGCFDELIRNCGGIVKNYGFYKSVPDIEEKRREAWLMIRDSIDKGLPCYAWELDKPMYYLIAGYDEIGYYYIEPDSLEVTGPKPYQELGATEWGCLEIHIIRPGSISDNLKTIKDVFEYAINVGNPEVHAPNEGYTMGTEAYRVWWEALLSGQADSYGVAYNASFWSKCKKMAVLFLKESKLRIGILETQFDSAISHFEACGKSLSQLSQMFPVRNEKYDTITEQQRKEAVSLLKAAHISEKKGLEEINNLLSEIYKIW